MRKSSSHARCATGSLCRSGHRCRPGTRHSRIRSDDVHARVARGRIDTLCYARVNFTPTRGSETNRRPAGQAVSARSAHVRPAQRGTPGFAAVRLVGARLVRTRPAPETAKSAQQLGGEPTLLVSAVETVASPGCAECAFGAGAIVIMRGTFMPASTLFASHGSTLREATIVPAETSIFRPRSRPGVSDRKHCRSPGSAPPT